MKTRTGLTLVDLLLSMVILAIIMSAVFAVFTYQQKATQAAAEGSEASNQGLVILNQLSRDLAGLWLPAAAEEGYKFLAEGEKISFPTTTSLAPAEQGAPDLVIVEYRVAVDTEQASDRKILIRSQKDNPYSETWSDVVLTRDLISFETSFLGGSAAGLTETPDKWPEARLPANLPGAVQVKLSLKGAGNHTETFKTRVAIPLSWPMVPKINVTLPKLGDKP